MLAPPQAHVHMAHLCLQKNDLEAAVASYDHAVNLLRMKQELIDCYRSGLGPGLGLGLALRLA